ncbi:MAG: VWA domain-containing protein [Bacteroidetes bacterium]|nr:MAG: VWA domain-containing protein [Bacteroidota bacterium]
MYRLEHEILIWLLLLIPLFWIIQRIYRHWQKNSISKIGNPELIHRLMPGYKPAASKWRFFFYMLSVFFLIIGMTNPQIGSKLEEVKKEGVEIMICLDVSNSMKAEDLTPNRLERAKLAIEKLLKNLHGDKIGIIVFAGEAYVQLPMTIDYGAAKLFLENIDPSIMPVQGTAIGNAIELALESFDYNSPAGKAIIVITDGENNQGDAIVAAQKAVEKGVTVHTIGVGSPEGVPIPVYRGGRKIGYKTDKEGNTVITKLNEEMLKQIAEAGNGVYVKATNANLGLEFVLEQINKMQKAEYGTRIYSDYEDRFQIFIALAMLFLIVEMLIPLKKLSVNRF